MNEQLGSASTTAAAPAPGPRIVPILLLVAIALGVGLRLKNYFARGAYWHDEASLVVNIFEKPAAQLLGRLEMAQAAPPGFLLIERAMYVRLGRSELAMRLVPLLVAIAALLLFAALSWRETTPPVAVLLTFLFACSERLIWHAAEAKQYSFDLFAALLLLWFALDAPRRSPVRRLLICAATACVAIWFSYAVVFVFGGISLALLPSLLRRGGRRGAIAWIAANAVFALTLLAVYLITVRHQQVSALYTYWADRFVDFSRPWLIPIWLIKQTISISNYALDMAGVVLTALAVIGGIAMARNGRRQQFAILIIPAGLLLLAAALRQYPYTGSRLTLFLAPGAFLLAGAGMVELWRWAEERVDQAWRRWLAAAACGFPIAIAAFWGGRYLFHPPARANMRAPAQYIAERHREGEIVYANRVSEFRAYAPGIPFRDAQELQSAAPRSRFWLALSHTRGRIERQNRALADQIKQHAAELDSFTLPGGAALLFQPGGTPATAPATTQAPPSTQN